MRRLTRTLLGPQFNEAARQLWLRCLAPGATQDAIGEMLGLARGHLSKLLYGDQKAGRELCQRIQERLGIAAELWGQEPTEPFTLPAVAAEEEARAKLAAAEAQRRGRAA